MTLMQPSYKPNEGLTPKWRRIHAHWTSCLLVGAWLAACSSSGSTDGGGLGDGGASAAGAGRSPASAGGTESAGQGGGGPELAAGAAGDTTEPSMGGQGGAGGVADPGATGAAGDAGTAGVGGQPAQVVQENVRISPLNTLLELDVGAGAEQPFTALAHYSDGSSRDVSSEVTWSLDNAALGGFEQATLKLPGFNEVDVETAHIAAKLDGVEGVAQLTLVAHHTSGPDQDLLLILPFQPAAGASTRPVVVSPKIAALDLLLLMDVTGSMAAPITNLKNGFSSTIMPAIQAAVPDSQFGVAAFAEFPVAPYSSSLASSICPGALAAPDQPFQLKQAITGNAGALNGALSGLLNGASPIGCGGDLPESLFEALYQSATGSGLSGPSPTSVPANHTGVGGVAFRSKALHAILSVSDAVSHDVGAVSACADVNYAGSVAAVAHSRNQTKAALHNICARALGITVGTKSCNATSDLLDMATATGARVLPKTWGEAGVRPAGCAATQCCTATNGAGIAPDANGLCPLVFQAASDGSGVSTSIVSGAKALVQGAMSAQLMVSGGNASTTGALLPDFKSVASFVTASTAKSYELADPNQPAPSNNGSVFDGVFPGTSLTFDVTGSNDFVAQTAEPELFPGQLLVADDCLDEGVVPFFVLVPPLDLPAAD